MSESVCLQCEHKRYCVIGIHQPQENCAVTGCSRFEQKAKQTNADCIRAMTDEELAEFVNDAEFGFLDRPGMCDVCDHHLVKACLDCWLDWLRQEATT